MSNHSARLVEHLAALKPTLLDGAIGASATMALLDTLGCGLYGANQQWGRILRAQILHEGSRGMATLFGENVTVAPSRAALANGTASHGFELDDIIQGALVHPGAVVIPAALAVAEQSGASGERLLLGIVAGYEVIARLGWALGAEHNTRGYHTTGVAGPIAATVAAGIVLGLSMEIILSAIGIACSSAGGASRPSRKARAAWSSACTRDERQRRVYWRVNWRSAASLARWRAWTAALACWK